MPPKKRKRTDGKTDKSKAKGSAKEIHTGIEDKPINAKRARKDTPVKVQDEPKPKTVKKSEPKSKVKKPQKEEEEFVHWLMKSEPNTRIEKGVEVKFGFEDLLKEPDQTACWDGVRNYQARNFLRDKIKVGHECFFYHSNCPSPGIVGTVKVVKDGYPDHTQFDRKDVHYDPKSSEDAPRWFMVDVQYERWLEHHVSLSRLKEIHLKHKQHGGPLSKLALFT